jgi:exoribonuclease-2
LPDLVEWLDGQNLQRGTVKKEDRSKLQVTSLTGKSLSVPVKRFHLVHRSAGEAEAFFKEVDERAGEVDLELLHETVGPGEALTLEALAGLWFSSGSLLDRSALLRACIDGAPWFKVDAQGMVRSARSEEVERWQREKALEQALEEETNELSEALASGTGPELAARIVDCFIDEIMGGEGLKSWPALKAARDRTGTSVRDWLERRDRLPDPYAVHMHRFHKAFLGRKPPAGEIFTPSVTRYPAVSREEMQALADPDDLPDALHPMVFSIDDEGVQEIDDALSAVDLDEERFRVGVHIAAPALCITEGTKLHDEAALRCITVYQPDLKWTMLPLELIERFSLAAGRRTAAVSTYYTFSKNDFSLLEAEVRLEALSVTRNFTYSGLDAGLDGVFFPDLDDPDPWLEKDPRDYPWSRTEAIPREAAEAFTWLVPLARHLLVKRVKQGARLFNRREFRIKVERGGEVSITERGRNSLAEGVVTELMILNNGWTASYLAERDMPAIYRTQRLISIGNDAYRTRADLTVVPREHDGLGGALYCWSTSPLRRYADLLNQRQLLSLITDQVEAFTDTSELLVRAKKTEFQNKTADLHQRRMEQYWVMKYLEAMGETAHPVEVIRGRERRYLSFTQLPLRLPLGRNQEAPDGPAEFTPQRYDFFALNVEGNTETEENFFPKKNEEMKGNKGTDN